jgi:hypothetical protein
MVGSLGSSTEEYFMSNSNVKDDKNMGNADKDQRDKDQRANADKQASGQRQQSTGQPGSANVQQGGHSDDQRQPGHQQGSKPADTTQSNDHNRKSGKT